MMVPLFIGHVCWRRKWTKVSTTPARTPLQPKPITLWLDFFAALKDGLTCIQIKYKNLSSTILEYKIQGHLQMGKFRGFAKLLERWQAMYDKQGDYILSC